jgi:putative FmdB family regulatory protein
MPIYEFKCLDCEEFVEFLFTNKDNLELKCPKCESTNLDRVLSCTSYSMKGDAASLASAETRNCSSGSCTTYTVPGVE